MGVVFSIRGFNFNRRSQAIHRAITIERAGVYNCVFAGGTKPYPLCYLEFYKSLTEHRDVSQENLLYLLHRLGYLGPEAEAIAI